MLLLCLQLSTEAPGPCEKAHEAGKEGSEWAATVHCIFADNSPFTVSLQPFPDKRAGEAALGRSRHLLGNQLSCHAGYDVILDPVVARKILPAVILRGPRTED